MTTLSQRILANKRLIKAALLDGPPGMQPRRKKRVRREDPVHIAIKNYLETTLPKEFIVHHSRNGGLSKAENGRSKAMGTKKGFPDLMILGSIDVGPLVPIMVPNAWLMEVKTDDGELDADQRKLHRKLRALGFKVEVVRSIDDARALILQWGLPSSDHLVVRARERALEPKLEAP